MALLEKSTGPIIPTKKRNSASQLPFVATFAGRQHRSRRRLSVVLERNMRPGGGGAFAAPQPCSARRHAHVSGTGQVREVSGAA